MALMSSLYTLTQATAGITALIGTRFRPQIARSGDSLPYTIYTRVSRKREPASTGSTGHVSTVVRMVHFADEYDDAEAVAEQFRLALDGRTGTVGDQWFKQCFLTDESDNLDPVEFAQNDAPHFVSQEYTIVHKETPTGL